MATADEAAALAEWKRLFLEKVAAGYREVMKYNHSGSAGIAIYHRGEAQQHQRAGLLGAVAVKRGRRTTRATRLGQEVCCGSRRR